MISTGDGDGDGEADGEADGETLIKGTGTMTGSLISRLFRMIPRAANMIAADSTNTVKAATSTHLRLDRDHPDLRSILFMTLMALALHL
jgi:hypothetical protein